MSMNADACAGARAGRWELKWHFVVRHDGRRKNVVELPTYLAICDFCDQNEDHIDMLV